MEGQELLSFLFEEAEVNFCVVPQCILECDVLLLR